MGNLAAAAHVPANRVLVGPRAGAPGFHQSSPRVARRCGPGRRNIVPEQRDAQRLEIFGRNPANVAVRPWVATPVHATLDGERRRWSKPAERKWRGDGGGRDSGKCGKLLVHAAIKSGQLLIRFVLIFGKLNGCGHHARRIESRIDLHQRVRLFRNNPAPTSKTSARATCPTTRSSRRRCRPCPEVTVRDSACSVPNCPRRKRAPTARCPERFRPVN